MRLFSVVLCAGALLLACTSDQDLGTRPGEADGAGPDAGDSGQVTTTDASGSGGPTSDGATDSQPQGDGGAWTPKQLTGLQLWLDNTAGVVTNPSDPGRVTRWLDQSGNGNDATGGQGGVYEPKIDPSAIHGMNAILFPGQSWMSVANAPGLAFGTNDWAIVVVAKPQASLVIWSQNSSTVFSLDAMYSLGVLSSGTGGGRAGVTNITPNKFQILSARGKKLEVRGGGNVGNGPTTTNNVLGGTVNIGMTSPNSSPADLAEVIAVKGTLSDADLAKTETYLKTKFGL